MQFLILSPWDTMAFTLEVLKQPQVCWGYSDLRENCPRILLFNYYTPPISHLCPPKACGGEQVEGGLGIHPSAGVNMIRVYLQPNTEGKLLGK